MTGVDYSQAPWGLAGARYAAPVSDLFQTADTTVSRIVGATTLSHLSALNAQAYLVDLVGTTCPRSTNTVRMLFSTSGVVTAFEFREDTENWAHRIRRVYNLFLGLVGFAQATIADVRKMLDYVVVREDMTRPGSSSVAPLQQMTASLSAIVKDPWEYDVEDVLDDTRKKDERKLTGFICHKAYIIYKDEVDKYIRAKNWR